MELLDLVAKQWYATLVEFNRSKKNRGITLLAWQQCEVEAGVPRRGYDAAKVKNRKRSRLGTRLAKGKWTLRYR